MTLAPFPRRRKARPVSRACVTETLVRVHSRRISSRVEIPALFLPDIRNRFSRRSGIDPYGPVRVVPPAGAWSRARAPAAVRFADVRRSAGRRPDGGRGDRAGRSWVHDPVRPLSSAPRGVPGGDPPVRRPAGPRSGPGGPRRPSRSMAQRSGGPVTHGRPPVRRFPATAPAGSDYRRRARRGPCPRWSRWISLPCGGGVSSGGCGARRTGRAGRPTRCAGRGC